MQGHSKRLGCFTLKDDSDSEEKKVVTSGSLFFKKLQKKSSPPPMSTAAEVRAASTAASSSDDRKAGATSTVQEVRHPVAKDRHPVAMGGQLPASDRHPVANDKLGKVGEKTSPKTDVTHVQRRTSEVGFFSGFFWQKLFQRRFSNVGFLLHCLELSCNLATKQDPGKETS